MNERMPWSEKNVVEGEDYVAAHALVNLLGLEALNTRKPAAGANRRSGPC